METDTNRIQGVKGSGGKVLKPFITKERWTILRILKEVEEVLRSEGISNPRYDAEALLSDALNLDRVGLYACYDRILTGDEVSDFLALVERRKRREPLQYILGSTEFYGLEFLVTPDILIPRPETELLVEVAIRLFTVHGSPFTVLDLCTGSGCIAIALAKTFPDSRVFAVDISEKALRVAMENSRRHRVEERIKFVQGSIFEPFTVYCSRFTVHGSKFDLIVSNPPYIPSDGIDFLQPEVRDYEPREALDGGPDGLCYLREIIDEAPAYLRSGGSLLLEIGQGQSERVCKAIVKTDAYQSPEVIKDYAGLYRVVVAIKN